MSNLLPFERISGTPKIYATQTLMVTLYIVLSILTPVVRMNFNTHTHIASKGPQTLNNEKQQQQQQKRVRILIKLQSCVIQTHS